MIWLAGLALVGAMVLLSIVWDLRVCGGRRCAQLVDRFVLFPQVRARRRARCDAASRSAGSPVRLDEASRRRAV